jgi:hypothetical protein
MPVSWFAVLAAIVPIGVQFVIFLRWLHRRMRDDEIIRAFVRDMALTHLPHIYKMLREVSAKQGTATRETPMVNFVDFQKRRRSR